MKRMLLAALAVTLVASQGLIAADKKVEAKKAEEKKRERSRARRNKKQSSTALLHRSGWIRA